MTWFRLMFLAALVASGCTVDPSDNEFYCGDGTACASGRTCVDGYCVLGAADGGGDARADADAAVDGDAAVDAGECEEGEPCYTGAAGTQTVGPCEAGVWRCGEPGTADDFCEGEVTPLGEACNGVDDDCNGIVDDAPNLDTNDDCGRCGNACVDGDTECCADSDGLFECRNTSIDDEFCGACTGSCDATQSCCGGGCVDTQSDDDHCGACGEMCGEGRTCCSGVCVNLDSASSCGPSCDEQRMCSDGESCCGSACEDSGAEACTACDPPCAVGEACRFGECVDPMTDPRACGNGVFADCGEGLCCAGVCTDRCDGLCTDDGDSCGACGVGCAENELCCGGGCVPNNATNCAECGTSCGAGTVCCPETGCRSLDTTANCGACGNVCPGETMCVPTLPSAGASTCCGDDDGEEVIGGACCGDVPSESTCGTGSCLDLNTNRDHCGRCGNECDDGAVLPLPRPRQDCIRGTCQVP